MRLLQAKNRFKRFFAKYATRSRFITDEMRPEYRYGPASLIN
jgi:hypothetical protein